MMCDQDWGHISRLPAIPKTVIEANLLTPTTKPTLSLINVLNDDVWPGLRPRLSAPHNTENRNSGHLPDFKACPHEYMPLH